MRFFEGVPNLRQGLLILFSWLLLFTLAQFNYLFFHTLAELISIVVAILIYVLGTQTYEFSRDNFLFFLGKGYFFLAILNLFHLLTYYGMGIFPGISADIPTQFWITYRMLNALTFLIAPIFSRREFPKALILGGYALWTGFSIVSILWLRIFPTSFIGGQGLTTFKINSEYTIILIFCAAIINVRIHRNSLHANIYRTLLRAMALSICTEILFTLYIDVYGLSNLWGHLFEILSLYLIYTGIISRGLRAPFQTIFTKLMDSNHELKEVNRYKSDFFSGIGHEMRTPLTAILAFSEDLLQEKVGGLNSTQKEHVRDIYVNGKSLLFQINDLLDFSKIESGKMMLELTEIQLQEILREETNLLRSVAQRKSLTIVLTLTNGTPIIADEYKIRQVIRNLLSNAIK